MPQALVGGSIPAHGRRAPQTNRQSLEIWYGVAREALGRQAEARVPADAAFESRDRSRFRCPCLTQSHILRRESTQPPGSLLYLRPLVEEERG
jgi:hypothetical protein